MSKIGKVILIMLCMVIGAAQKTYAQDVTDINKLIEDTREYDQKELIICGEVIGEGLERGTYTWINITDSTNAIGVWIPTEDVKKIKYFGDYKYKGDILLATGIFNRACAEHGGETDFHSKTVTISKVGYETIERIEVKKIVCLIVLAGCSSVLLMIYWKKFKRNPK